MIKPCAMCNKPTELKANGKYCPECRKIYLEQQRQLHNEYQTEHRAHKKQTTQQPQVETESCIMCGSRFAVTKMRKLFCSRKCYLEARRLGINTAVYKSLRHAVFQHPTLKGKSLSEVGREAKAAGMSYGQYELRCRSGV